MKIVIKNLLDKRCMHIRQLSILANIPYNNLHRLCSGKTSQIMISNIEKICKVLNCTPNDLFEIE